MPHDPASPPRPPSPAAHAIALSALQGQIWSHERLFPGTALYVVPLGLELEGALQIAALAAALQDVVARHPALRVRVLERGGQVLQEVREPFEPGLRVTDLSHVPAEQRPAALAERSEVVQRTPLPLREGPLLRFELVRLAPRHHVLLGAVHHLVFDAHSLELLLHDLLEAYACRERGDEPSRPAASDGEWLDHVRWGVDQRQGLERQREAWSRRLCGELPSFGLFADRTRPSTTDLTGAYCTIPIDAALVDRVTAHARASRSTPYAVVLAALFATLARHTGEVDQLLGTPVLGRTRSAWLATIGLFVNTLPIRVRVEGTFAQLVAQVHARAREAQIDQDLPVSEIIRELRLPRELGRSPLFQALFTHRRMRPLPTVPSMVVRRWSEPPRLAKFEASFSYVEHEPGQPGELTADFRTASFAPASVEGLLRHVRCSLEAGLERPQTMLADLPLMEPSEQRAVLRASAAPERPLPPGPGAHRLFEQQVRHDPEALAVIAAGRPVSRRELDVRANRVARWLVAQQVGPDVVVALRLDKGIDFIAASLGVMKAGGCYLPLDPALPRARQQLMLELASAAVVITAPEHAWADEGRPALVLDGRGRAALEALPATPPEREGSGDDLVNILFTSGSTGTPKAVALPHRGMLRFVTGTNFHRIGPSNVVLQVSPVNFDGHTFEIFAALSNGACVVVVDKDELLDPQRLPTLVTEHGVDVLVITTPLLNRIVEACPEVLERMTTIIFGGEMVSIPHIARALERCGPGVLVHTYGPTECSFTACFHVIDRIDPSRWTIPIGRPISHTDLYILDEALRPVPHGVVGDIYLSGPGLAREYLGAPDKTAAAFVPNPFARDAHTARMYRTGDRGRRSPDGLVEFVGRRDHQVKIRGQRVELGEVEASLREQPGVASVHVAVHERAGSQRMTAYVVPTGGATQGNEARLRAALTERLPAVMVPERIVFLDVLPLRPNGKVDLQQLAAAAEARSARSQRGPEEGDDPLEHELTALWLELLELSSLDPETSFFEAGGDSLLLMRLQAEVSRRFDVSLGITEYFAHGSVRALGRRIRRARGEAHVAAASPAGRTVDHPLASSLTVLVRRPELAPIAVVGMGLRLPGAEGPDALAELLHDGAESISRFELDALEPEHRDAFTHADRPWVGAEGILEAAGELDPVLLGIPGAELHRMEVQHRVLAECVWQALEEAGLGAALAGRRVAVYAGCSPRRLEGRSQALDGAGALGGALGRDPTFLATRISHRLDLRGESITVDTACSTALVATHLAIEALRRGDCDHALAGAVSVQSPQGLGYLHYPNYIFSARGRCRPYDAEADGTVPGSGGGVLVLRRLPDAERDGDPIHALLLGSALDNDGRDKIGFTAPSQSGQAAVIARALARAGRVPADLGYIEGHGTGTALGDPIEVAALHEVLGAVPRGRIGLGSIKSNMGHLGPAAGIAGLAKAILSVERGLLFPSLHYEAPNREIDFGRGPLFVTTTAQPWDEGNRARHAGVSAFGIGGTNAHVIVGEAGR